MAVSRRVERFQPFLVECVNPVHTSHVRSCILNAYLVSAANVRSPNRRLPTFISTPIARNVRLRILEKPPTLVSSAAHHYTALMSNNSHSHPLLRGHRLHILERAALHGLHQPGSASSSFRSRPASLALRT